MTINRTCAWIGLLIALPCFGCGGEGDLCQTAADHVAECLGSAPEPVATCTEAMADAASDLLAQTCDQIASRSPSSYGSSCNSFYAWLGLCNPASSCSGFNADKTYFEKQYGVPVSEVDTSGASN
jgi:hypothetical protein